MKVYVWIDQYGTDWATGRVGVSGKFEGPISYDRAVELSDAEFADLEDATDRYRAWTERLEKEARRI